MREVNKKANQLVRWWGSTNRDDTRRIATVVYNACYHLFRKRLHTLLHLLEYMRLERDTNKKIAICVMSRRLQVHLSPVITTNKQKCLMAYKENDTLKLRFRKTVNFFEIRRTIIEKLQPEHDPKWPRLCDLLQTGSSWWCHFWWGHTDLPGLRAYKFVSY